MSLQIFKHAWSPVPDPAITYVLAASASAIEHTGTTAETALATFTVPAGAMGPKGILRVTSLWSVTAGTNLKTLRLKFGGTDFGVIPISGGLDVTARMVNMIRNRNVRAQIAPPVSSFGDGLSSDPVITGTVDTSLEQPIALTAELANPANTITLEAAFVEIIPFA